jgi:hypothetical protein
MSFEIPIPTLRALSKLTGEEVTTTVVVEWRRDSRHELPQARARIAALEAQVARLTQPDDHVAAFERDKILEAMSASGKVTPFLVENVLADMPLAKLRVYAQHAIAVMPSPKEQLPFEDRNFHALASTAARFEDMPPAARVALHLRDPSTWQAMHDDYVGRGSPEPRAEKLFGRASNGIPLAYGVTANGSNPTQP